jgi:hypothetical protein
MIAGTPGSGLPMGLVLLLAVTPKYVSSQTILAYERGQELGQKIPMSRMNLYPIPPGLLDKFGTCHKHVYDLQPISKIHNFFADTRPENFTDNAARQRRSGIRSSTTWRKSRFPWGTGTVDCRRRLKTGMRYLNQTYWRS